MAITYTTPSAAETILSTGLNSLANNDSQISSALDNDDLNLFARADLYLAAQGSARSAGAVVELYLLPSIDGSNYPYGSDSLVPAANLMVGNFQLDATTTARYAASEEFKLPPTDFKLVLVNKTGQAFASSGNVLRITRYSLASA